MENSKTFWKTGIHLKIIILSHERHSCLEVVSFNPTTGTDYPRIYIDLKMILSKLNLEAIRKTVALRQEECDRSKIKMDKHVVLAEIKSSFLVKYIYDRVNLIADSNVSRLVATNV